MGSARGVIRLGCIAIAVWVISQVVIGLTAPFWLAPLIGVFGTAMGASSDDLNTWYAGCQGCLGCAVLNLTLLWLLVGPVNLRLRGRGEPVAPRGDDLTSLAMKGWRNRGDSVEDSE